MITIFVVQTKVIYFKNIYKFCENGSFFTWFLAHTNVQTDKLCSIAIPLTIISPWKQNLFNEKIMYMEVEVLI